MTKLRAVGLLLLAALAFGLVLALAVGSLARDREGLILEFTRERVTLLNQAALELGGDIEAIGDDLRLAARLAATADSVPDRERELAAILGVVRAYRRFVVVSADGSITASVTPAEDAPAPSPQVDAALLRAAADALARPDRLATSAPVVTDDGAWLRVFAIAPPAATQAIAVVADTRPLFGKLNLLAADPGTDVLVLGAHGAPAPISAAPLAAPLTSTSMAGIPGYAAMVARMRAGEHGSTRLSAREARALGFAEAELVAVYAPVNVVGGDRWSISLLVSTAPLRDHLDANARRLVLAIVFIGVVFAGVGAAVLIWARRAIAVRERLRHADRLAHLHEKAEKILDTIPTGVLALGEDGAVTAANRMIRDRVGDLRLGAGLDEALPSLPAPELARMRRLAEAARAVGRAQSLFAQPLRLFGEVGQFNLHAVPLERRFPDARVLLVIEDLSKLRALESQLLHSEKLATIGVLAAGIAHEVGTPLGVVRGRAEYMLGKLDSDEPQAGGLRVIVDQIDQVTRIIRQLLDFARARPADAQSVALAPVAREVAELLRIEAERRSVTLELSLGDELPPLLADADQLQQVLVNLVMNACDACEPGGRVVLAAMLAAGAEAPAVRIELRDDGRGIAPELVHQVFDPFFTTKKRGQGTGLGLSIVSEIVRNHGGSIELDSKPGRGTTVRIEWPAAAADSARHAG